MKTLVVKPFFTEEEIDSVQTAQSNETNCSLCKLYKGCISPKMSVTGQGKKKILIIAEAPGKNEDEKNIQLIGDAGQYLRKKLAERNIDLEVDCWKTNSIVCRPPNNRKPTKRELKLCKQNYTDFIQENKPKFIFLLGAAAIESYFGGRLGEDGGNLSPTRWRGLCIPDPVTNAWVIPLFHPSYAKRFEWDNLIQSQYERDLDFAVSCLKKQDPIFYDVASYITILSSFKKAKTFLLSLIKANPKLLAFDYETTGLKPFNKGHKIVSVSVCCEPTKAYSFPLQHPCFTIEEQKELMSLWKKILENNSIKKVAHNLSFEDLWSNIILDALVSLWESCTMNTAHILDSRTAFTGLKFQAFVRWGIQNYDAEMKKYLSSNGAEFNRIVEAPLDKLLLYNGIDSLLTYWLYEEQEKEMNDDEKWFQQFNKEGLIVFSDMQSKGILADLDYYKELDKELKDKIKILYKNLFSSDEAKLFKKNKGREISFTSDKDLRELFFKLMKLPVVKETDTGLPSVDAEAIKSLDCSIAKDLLEVSKLEKIKGTYVGQFLREINEDGRIHPFYSLSKTTTFRSSSSNPNWQNIPVRDTEAKKYIRSGIYPSRGNLIVDYDYSALEVRICACVTEDDVLINYINDPTTDMHRDIASQIFKLNPENVSKDLRFYAKNGFVFPEFYGSYFKNCAKNVWKACEDFELKTKEGQFIFDHLASKNIKVYQDFENHLEDVERDFWDRFRIFKKWQEKKWKFYEKNGYVQLITGPRCKGFLTRNDVINYHIQGPAFHCLLYSLINTNNHFIDADMQSFIIGQIHDCMLIDTFPEEKNEVISVSKYIATEKIREDWKWIIVPLDVEVETTEIDQTWYLKTDYKEE